MLGESVPDKPIFGISLAIRTTISNRFQVYLTFTPALYPNHKPSKYEKQMFR